MTTLAIDLDELDQLCENQKKLDDIFDSLWDDDSFISIATPVIEHSQIKAPAQKDRTKLNLLFPIVLEIAAIYYGIVYLI